MMRNSRKITLQTALRHGVALLASAMLAACASTPPPASPPPPAPPPPPSSAPPPSSQSEAQSEESQQAERQQRESEAASAPQQGAQSPPAQPGAQAPDAGQAGAPPPPADGTTGQDTQAKDSDSKTANTGGPPPGAQTGAERSRELQGEFERSLGEFDDRLAREQGELETLSDKQASANSQRERQDADRGLEGGVNGDRIGRAAAPLPPPGDAGLPEDGTRNRRPGSPGDRASLPPAPDDVPSGQNDDVVARQLREAAENETDPELREKLWEEYRQYKRNNG